MSGPAALRVGTRGSTLALRQTDLVLAMLRERNPRREFEVVVASTQGDRRQDVPISSLGEGVFVTALETALRAGELDLAVHSAKDVPVDGEPDDLILAAYPERGDARDALIAQPASLFETLPIGALVATGSPRRAAQLLARRGDLRIVGVRGNVDTRIRKLRAGEFDALVVAAAGLERLDRIGEASELLEMRLMTPAAGQGALAVQCRSADAAMRQLAATIDHPPTRQAVMAERAVLRGLGGGCKVPVGVFAEAHGAHLRLRAVIAAPDGGRLIEETLDGVSAQPEELGARMATLLASRGADLLADSRSG